MKKLMTVLASAATALFTIGAANGDEAPLNATSFEQLKLNTQLNTLADDTGDTEGLVKYWFMASTDADNGTLVTNEVAGAGVSRPDYFAKMNQANTKALSLDTSSPLFRHMGTSDGTIPAAGEAIGTGIYLDTLVKFTAADDVFGDDALATGDKIAISYVEQSDEVADPITNFVIRAGYIGSQRITPKNYVAKLPNDATFDKEVWHRLTVRTIPNIDADTDGNVGFVVYVDEVPLVYADANETIGDNVTLVGVAATVADSVFPSAVAANNGTDGLTITSASFSGTGAIDDVVFTKEMPDFIAASSAVPVSITLGTGVTGVTVTVGQETINPVNDEATPLVFNLPTGTTSFSLAGTLDTGYQNFTAVFAEEDQTSTFVNGTVSFTGVSLAFTVKASRNNFTYLNDNDEPQTAVTLTEAIENVKDGGTIKLAYDYKVADFESFSADHEERYVIDEKDITLDLNGKTLDGGENDDYSLFFVGGEMTVIDSATGGKIIYGGAAGVFYVEGTLTIGAASDDNGVYIDGLLFADEAEGDIVRANINVADNSEDDAFLWGGQVVRGSNTASEPVNGYWVVEPTGGEPVEVNFTVGAANANSTVVVKTNDVVVAFADLPAKLTEGQTYEVTYTADEGYHFVTEQGNQTSIVVSGTVAKADITITAPTAEQNLIGTYEVTVTPAENATYAAAYKVGGETITPENDVLTVTVGQTIVITATPAANFEYATTPDGWTAGQDGKITIEVSAAGTVAIPEPTAQQQGGYPTYIDTTDADAKAKYDDWKETYGADTASAHKDAFLLNIAPDADDQTLEPASITIAGGKVVITANQNLGTVNGKVYVKTATTFAGLKTAEWAEASLDETTKAINVTPGSSDTAGFYQIKVDF